ncbi:zincin [Lizonia empirigonia]|nr:zincin [Lizonia empirigonia]
MICFTSIVLLGAAAVSASPLAARQATTVTVTATAQAPTSTAWDAGAVHEYPIHASCNATQRQYIKNGLEETLTICRQARDHILRWGNSSQIYQKYFGNAPTGEPIGWYTKIVDGDKSNILFRCDNIDGNCAQKAPSSSWGLCMFGYDVANGATNFYWASDLLHRLLHVPEVGEGIVEHYGDADEYPGVLELAESNPAEAVRNSDTLQYFALEVYAHDIAVPGVGCPGSYREISSSSAHGAPTSSAGVASSSVVASATAVEPRHHTRERTACHVTR